MATEIDQLINEIVIITGLSEEEVRLNYTQDQLDRLLNISKCEEPSSVAPLIEDLDLPCNDLGAPADPPSIGIDEIIDEISKGDQSDPLDTSKCVDAVDDVNKEVQATVNKHTEHNILLNKAYELQDNIEPVKYYYQERSKHMALILGIFEPILREIKRLESEIEKIDTIDLPPIEEEIDELEGLFGLGNSTALEKLKDERTRLNNLKKDYQQQITEQENLRDEESLAFPALQNPSITNYHYGSVSQYSLVSSINSIISESTISELQGYLTSYSEYIRLQEQRPTVVSQNSYNVLTSPPLIRFDVRFQNLIYSDIDREDIDMATGSKSIVKQRYLIKDNPLYNTNSFYEGVPGYVIRDSVGKPESNGFLYERYYNKLNDPANEFFSVDERGLTSNASLLDPKLVGSAGTTKKENNKEYYIRDIDKMQNFYKDFDNIFEVRKKEVRAQVKRETIEQTKEAFEQLARADIELMLAFGRVNLYLPEDDDTTASIIDKLSSANEEFIIKLTDLDSEISRLEQIVNDSKPTPQKVKAILKQKSPECFDKIDEDPGGCPDVDSLRGSDPFFESLGGSDPTLPNFSQHCYWKEFAKLANVQGLFPIPNNPSTLRYWPVGLIIPTPATIIKIPLPQIWIPLVTVSTPLGVLVTFLNINGIFISPVIFFMSASGYKQHMITVRGSSKKFGSDSEDELIKPNIKVPLNVASGIAVSRNGGPVDVNKELTEKEKARIKILEEKEKDAEKDGDTVRSRKAKKEIKGIKQAAADRKKPAAKKMEEVADKGEKVEDMVAKVKRKIFKNMDDLGKPSLRRIDKLKERSVRRKEKLMADKLEAMEQGDTKRLKRINKKLESDGLTIEEKKKAYTDDLLDYFDKITFPTVTLPKETDKLNPKETGTVVSKDLAKEAASSGDVDYMSNHSANMRTVVGVTIAKHKSSIEEVAGGATFDIDKDTDKIKGTMKNMLKRVKDKATGKGSNPVDPAEAIIKLKEDEANFKNEKDPQKKEKARKKLERTQTSLSEKLSDERTKQVLSMTPAVIAAYSGVNLQIDPFAPCCSKDNLSVGYSIPLAIDLVMDQGLGLIASAIDGMSLPNLKSLFGGKRSIGAIDMRLALHNIARSAIPTSLSIPKPELNLKSATAMFSGLLGGLAMPQASLPLPLSTNQLNAKVSINLGITKTIIKNGLSEYLGSSLLQKNSQNLNIDFMTTSPNDIKAFMKTFIESMSDSISDKLDTFYSIINSPLIKNGNGLNLNILENQAFNFPPFGQTAKSLFIAKGKLKFSLKKSQSQFVIDQNALKIASGILVTSLQPIVSNPVAGLLVASAGVTNSLDTIRELHPILSADDTPPWERLTAKNILFLIFLDEFISTGADQVGFFRSYL